MDQDDILLDCEERMEKATTNFRNQIKGLRTGRATPGLVDNIRVEVYGSETPLKQIAQVSIPEPQQIMIRPYDQGNVAAIGKAIQSSDVGLAPKIDGRVIRLNVPPLSTDRRKQLVARVKEFAEEARVSIRNVRRDANKHADTSEKDKILTEDLCEATKEEIQNLTKKYEGMVNDEAAAKEKQVMEE